MHRFLKIGAVLIGLMALGLLGWTTAGGAAAGDGPTLTLNLPPSYAADKATTLEIDGKDYSKPAATRRTIKLDKVPDKAVQIVYSFWPNSYTNITRTREVKLKKDETVTVDFSKDDASKANATLVLRLSASLPAPSHAPERITTLKIDGKDFSEPRNTRRTIKLDKVPTKDLQVVYSFWPNSYTNLIRTRQVPVKSGDIAKVDFTKEDPKQRDNVKPIYYPTPHSVVVKMCELAKVTNKDVVWDIGCGDGRMVMTAVEKFKAKKGVGIDLRPELVKKCQAAARDRKIDDRCFFRQGNALKDSDMKDLPEANVVLLYLGEHLNMRLRPVLQKKLKPGSRVVSHLFDMGDWKPDQTITFEAKSNEGDVREYTLHLWIIK